MRARATILISTALWLGCGDDGAREAPPAGEATPSGERSATQEPVGDPARDVEAVPEPRDGLALGAAHTCLLRADGSVRCWGSHRFGQLGTDLPPPGPAAHLATPVPVEGLSDAVAVAAGAFHTCALRRGGRVSCWGHGGFGQLGDTAGADRTTPMDVSLPEPAVSLAAGEGHTCARLASRRVLCWGRNTFGQLGDGSTEASTAPRAVEGLEQAVEIGAGRDHTCARLAGGAVACWGAGFEGQLGGSERPERRARPAPVPGIAEAAHLMVGSAHACVVARDGAVRCWGRNDSGQVGDGRGGGPEDVTGAPAPVAGLGPVEELAGGARHTCARLSSGAVRCWGYDGFGQLGAGSDEPLQPAPVDALGVEEARALAAGARHTCVLHADLEVSCWGRNHLGQLGDGTTEDRRRPAPVRL